MSTLNFPDIDKTRGRLGDTRRAILADVPYLMHLASKMKEELGFLPRPAVEIMVDFHAAVVSTQNDESAGFLLARRYLTSAPHVMGIMQAAVQMDARRRAHGLAMIEHLIGLAGEQTTTLQCWCASELTANAFWKAAGFTAIREQKGGKSRNRQVTLWRKAIGPNGSLTGILEPIHRPGGVLVQPSATITANTSLFDHISPANLTGKHRTF